MEPKHTLFQGVVILDYEPGIGAKPSLAAHVADQERRFGKLYCGGQIEASIREMLAQVNQCVAQT